MSKFFSPSVVVNHNMAVENIKDNGSASLKDVIYKPLSVSSGQEEKPTEHGDSWFLYFSVSAVCLVFFTSGSDFVWTSPVIPKLLTNNSEVNPLGRSVTPLEESLIAGSCVFGGTIGCLLLGNLPDIYGRRNVLIYISVLKSIAYVILAFANVVYLYYISRLFLGICFGMAIGLIPNFITEICQDANRGKFGAFAGLFLTLGNLYGFIIGSIFSIRTFTLLCGAPLILNLLSLVVFIPDSPVYLITHGDKKGAKLSLKTFRQRSSSECQHELDEMESILRHSSNESYDSWLSLFKTKWLRSALIAAVGVNMFQQFSGVTAIVGFIGPVFDSAGCGLSGNSSAIIVGFVQVVSFGLAANVVDRLGRRVLLLVSLIMSAFSLISLGTYFYMLNVGVYLENVSWLSVTCLILFFVSYCIGLGPVPLIVMSELFPTEVKSVAASITSFSSGFSACFAIVSFPFILSSLGPTWCFWLFSIFCIVGAIFVYFFVPETKGKNITDIQKIFNS